MSGLGGFWQRDDRAPSMVVLDCLATHLARRGPDGTHRVWRAPVGWVHCRHDTTSDLDAIALPLVASDGTALVWDGRLDRRDELMAALGLPVAHHASDAELVLRAYRTWGNRCCERLDGDFAFALWDQRHQALVLARDRMGVCPLFFHQGRRGTIFASTLEALLVAADLPRDFDHEWFAGYFGAQIDPRRTPYRGITAVAPATVVTLREGGIRARTYWQPQPDERPDLDDRAHEARFARCFEHAVTDRMRTTGAVGADLSGGLDSSSIVAVAQAIGTKTILPVSIVTEHCPTADERFFLEHMERALGLESRRIRHEDHLPYATVKPCAYDTPGGMQSTGGREAAIDRWWRSRNARIVLRGHGGDHLLWSQVDNPPELADLATTRHFGALSRALQSWSTRLGRPILPLFAAAVVYPLLPRVLRRRWGPDAAQVSPLLDPGFVRRTGLRRRSFWEHGRPRRRGLVSSHERLADILSFQAPLAWGYDRGPGATEARYPFLDRRLIELCLGLPLDQLVRNGETRSIHRRAMRGLLPEPVRVRTSKAAFDEVVIRALRHHGARLMPLLKSPRVCDLGWVDGDALRTTFERNRQGIHDQTPVLRQILDLELWLRSHDVPADVLPASSDDARPDVAAITSTAAATTARASA